MIKGIGINPLKSTASAQTKTSSNLGATEFTAQFGTFLNDALSKINDQKVTVEKLNDQFAAGELTDVHKLLIASEKASLGLELTVHIRNKAIEAYQEIMRTQI